MDYISSKETAGKWGITQRKVESLCMKGRIKGVERIGSMWFVPKNAVKPIDDSIKAVKQKNKKMEHNTTIDANRIVGMVNSTMAMEHMPLTDEDRLRLHAVLNGEVTADEVVRQLVVKHRR